MFAQKHVQQHTFMLFTQHHDHAGTVEFAVLGYSLAYEPAPQLAVALQAAHRGVSRCFARLAKRLSQGMEQTLHRSRCIRGSCCCCTRSCPVLQWGVMLQGLQKRRHLLHRLLQVYRQLRHRSLQGALLLCDAQPACVSSATIARLTQLTGLAG